MFHVMEARFPPDYVGKVTGRAATEVAVGQVSRCKVDARVRDDVIPFALGTVVTLPVYLDVLPAVIPRCYQDGLDVFQSIVGPEAHVRELVFFLYRSVVIRIAPNELRHSGL